MLSSPLSLLCGPNMQMEEHMTSRSGGIEDDNNAINNMQVQAQAPPEFGQVVDVNLSPWTDQFYQTGASLFIFIYFIQINYNHL